jgi:hypothetical protein
MMTYKKTPGTALLCRPHNTYSPRGDSVLNWLHRRAGMLLSARKMLKRFLCGVGGLLCERFCVRNSIQLEL